MRTRMTTRRTFNRTNGRNSTEIIKLSFCPSPFVERIISRLHHNKHNRDDFYGALMMHVKVVKARKLKNLMSLNRRDKFDYRTSLAAVLLSLLNRIQSFTFTVIILNDVVYEKHSVLHFSRKFPRKRNVRY